MTTLILSVFFSISASAYDVEVDGIYYNLNTVEKTAEVTYKELKEENYTGDVIIPSSIKIEEEEYSVNIIGSSAFDGCRNIMSVEIPNSVITIGDCSFFDCLCLTNINIPNSVKSIGKFAFENCYQLRTVSISNSVTNIDLGAFANCTNLSSVTLPNSIEFIALSTFSGCSSLKSVDIPTSVTTIDSEAFKGCVSLTSITLPTSVVSIGDGAFSGCSNIISVIIPKFVNFISSYAFENCSSLSDFFCYPEHLPFTWDYVFEGTNIEQATLHVPTSAIEAYKTTEPWSRFGKIVAIEGTEDIKSIKDRGISIQSAGGFINISGLDNNEKVDFYGVDGKALGSAKSIDGSVSFSAKQGSVVVAKIGKESVKIIVE